MKTYIPKSFNSIFILLWMMITAIIWIVDDSQYPWYIQKILSGLALITTLVSTTYFLCNQILPKSIVTNKVGTIVYQLLLMSIFQAFLLWLFQLGLYWFEEQGLLPHSANFDERETIFQAILNALPATILVNLGFGGLKFYFEHSKLYEQHLQLQKNHLEVQLQALQAQINPHFMFNVLNHIHMLMQKDVELASDLLLKYSEILRYQLYSTKTELVSLDQEIQFMDGYIDVETYRWKNTLDVNRKWHIEDPRTMLPPLMLITFVENAFKHVSRNKANKGYINISLEQKSNFICLEVENSKSPINKKKNADSGIGLENIKKRLNILYSNSYSLSITETDSIYQTKLILKR